MTKCCLVGGRNAAGDARIRILLRIIEEHRGVLQMTSRQIGSLLGLGEARVLRLFSTEVGKPLRRHLLEVRMARAAELLKHGVMPIKTVAAHCGYNLVTNFYRDFKTVYGTSPMQMRLMHMNAQLDSEQSFVLPTVDEAELQFVRNLPLVFSTGCALLIANIRF